MVESLFIVLVVILLALAVFDLVVGVSNDAVNFLTSAVGAKAGTFRAIMIVASLGIFIGAISAGGMMEVARKGLFFPGKFSFQDIMFIYVVVMLSDVLLLDIFNSLKLPTSTTVSIVFELLGASMAISLLNMYHADVPLGDWGEYINATKALQKIMAIFLSVGLAFAFGWVVQFVLRTLVTFDYMRFKKLGGSLFGAVSVVIVINFIINVAFKNSPLKEWDSISWMIANFHLVSLLSFVLSAGVFLVLAKGNFDPFKFITFLGTFALAMAFASNDLVNFIGVPVASYDAFVIWKDSGIPAKEFMMTPFMEEGLPANQWFLVLAGLIMGSTLWLSKKARKVIQTSVDLSRQEGGKERFKPNEPVRWVVRGISGFANRFVKIIPDQVVNTIDNRFNRKPVMELSASDAPAFDMVRASVNLMVAALVISWGTAYKLPLSTTYVSFMVLMGTSLADRAWNRDSAVYRVSGVFAVIGGWFITALAAMSLAGFFAWIVYSFELIGVALVIAMVISGIVLVNKLTKETQSDGEPASALPEEWQSCTQEAFESELKVHVTQRLDWFLTFNAAVLEGLTVNSAKKLKPVLNRVSEYGVDAVSWQDRLSRELAIHKKGGKGRGKSLMKLARMEEGLFTEAEQLTRDCRDHLLNLHRPLAKEQILRLQAVNDGLKKEVEGLKLTLTDDTVQPTDAQELHDSLALSMEAQINGLIEERYNFKNSVMYFDYLDAMRDCLRILQEMTALAKHR